MAQITKRVLIEIAGSSDAPDATGRRIGLAIGRFISYGLVFILSALSPASWIWSILLLSLALAVIGMAYYLKPAEPREELAVPQTLQIQVS